MSIHDRWDSDDIKILDDEDDETTTSDATDDEEEPTVNVAEKEAIEGYIQRLTARIEAGTDLTAEQAHDVTLSALPTFRRYSEDGDVMLFGADGHTLATISESVLDADESAGDEAEADDESEMEVEEYVLRLGLAIKDNVEGLTLRECCSIAWSALPGDRELNDDGEVVLRDADGDEIVSLPEEVFEAADAAFAEMSTEEPDEEERYARLISAALTVSLEDARTAAASALPGVREFRDGMVVLRDSDGDECGVIAEWALEGFESEAEWKSGRSEVSTEKVERFSRGAGDEHADLLNALLGDPPFRSRA